jgi:hypothetical protein
VCFCHFHYILNSDADIGRYPMNATQYNAVQRENLQKSRLKIPLIQTGECLHGVGSFKQSMFPQSIGLSATFDNDLVYRVARAVGAEARSIGIHACFSPVLDLGLDPRWGRMQGQNQQFVRNGSSRLTQCRGMGRRQGPDVPYGSFLQFWLIQ